MRWTSMMICKKNTPNCIVFSIFSQSNPDWKMLVTGTSEEVLTVLHIKIKVLGWEFLFFYIFISKISIGMYRKYITVGSVKEKLSQQAT